MTIILPKGGTGRFSQGSASQSLVAGDVLVVNPEVSGRIQVVNNEDFLYWRFSVTIEHLIPLFAANELSLLPDIKEVFRTFKWFGSSSPVGQECQKLLAEVTPLNNLEHRSQVLRITATILSKELDEFRARRTGFIPMEDHLTQVFQQLTANEILSLPVGDLAKRFSCSRRHLNRLFHQYFGFSVAALRMEMRLLKAMSLLRNPDAKIINVAEQCGFNHLGLFNTCFKKRFGSSPGQWRKILVPDPSQKKQTVSSSQQNCQMRANGLCPWTIASPEGQSNGSDTRGGKRPFSGTTCEDPALSCALSSSLLSKILPKT